MGHVNKLIEHFEQEERKGNDNLKNGGPGNQPKNALGNEENSNDIVTNEQLVSETPQYNTKVETTKEFCKDEAEIELEAEKVNANFELKSPQT